MQDTTQTNPRLEFFRSQIGNDPSTRVSSLGRWLNGTLRVVDYGRLSVEFIIREDMTNPMGVLHGGSAAAMMDEVIGIMVFTLGREYGYTSVNLNCDFLNAARLGDVIIANAEVIRAGRNIVHCECELVTGEGKLIAKCTSNLIQTGVRLPG